MARPPPALVRSVDRFGRTGGAGGKADQARADGCHRARDKEPVAPGRFHLTGFQRGHRALFNHPDHVPRQQGTPEQGEGIQGIARGDEDKRSFCAGAGCAGALR